MSNDQKENCNCKDPNKPGKIEVYKVVASRRTSRDVMVWQTAAIALTAQSFLYTIALGGQTAKCGRLIALGLSFIASLATIHLMTKHRWLEIRDAELLKDLELGFWEDYTDEKKNPPHAKPRYDDECIFNSSYFVWQCFQRLFAICSIVIFIVILSPIGDSWLSGNPNKNQSMNSETTSHISKSTNN